MGWIIERKTDGGKTRFTAAFRDLRGVIRSAGTFTTRRDAERAWHRAELDLEAGRLGTAVRSALTLRAYVETQWLPHHVMEATTREGYIYVLNRHILPELGPMRLADILPGHVREWITELATDKGLRPPTIRKAKVILDAILTTALNDRLTVLHAGKGVRTPLAPQKPRPVITTEQFERIYQELPEGLMRLLVETAIETGLRWGELTELRVKDLDTASGQLTVSRAVVHLRSTAGGGSRFVVKEYPKDGRTRRLRVAPHLVDKITSFVAAEGLARDSLFFTIASTATKDHAAPVQEREADLGLTVPTEAGRRYHHGTITAYSNGRCRCEHCRAAMAAYRAGRRASGKDAPSGVRTLFTDGHIPNDWFRLNVWNRAVERAQIGFSVRPHDLRHAHASWLLAGGADIQVVKERLGHGSIITTEKYLRALPDKHDAALAALEVMRGAR